MIWEAEFGISGFKSPEEGGGDGMFRALALGFHLRGPQHIQSLTEQCQRRKVYQAPEREK